MPEDRTPYQTYFSPSFGGRTIRVMNPPGEAKPRELCQPFSFSLDGTDEVGQRKFSSGLEKLRRLEAREAKARAKAAA